VNIDYVAEAKKKQEERDRQRFQQARDPFQYGRQVAQRRYSEIMSGLAERQRQSARTYSDMYQAAKETATAQRAMGGPSLSGGMKAQYSDLVSAREMQALGTIGRDREAAAREIDLQRQSAFANAELEGQQAAQTELQNRQTKLQLIQQKNEILANKKLKNAEKAEQLRVLGYEQEANQLLQQPDTGTDATTAGIVSLVGGGIVATSNIVGGVKAILALGAKDAAGKAILTGGAKFAKIAAVGGKFLLGAVAVAAVIYGAMKLFDPENKSTDAFGFESTIDSLLGVQT
jgi:hypothetical protein